MSGKDLAAMKVLVQALHRELIADIWAEDPDVTLICFCRQ